MHINIFLIISNYLIIKSFFITESHAENNNIHSIDFEASIETINCIDQIAFIEFYVH
jgi:hypothetical protein